MILVRSPLRISLGGGGTDLQSYYEKNEGFLIAGAIDKYVYISILHRFVDEILLKYSNIEACDRINQIKHPIIREAMTTIGIDRANIEISIMADIPAGTGLGSSGSFTTGLIKALMGYQNKVIKADELAEMACHIEIDKLGEPIGKQDQYIAAYGGLTCFTFHKNGTVSAQPLLISEDTKYDLEDNLLLFFTGFSRSASQILKDQHERSVENDFQMIANLDYVKQLGYQSKVELENGNVLAFGEIMNEHWEFKKKRSKGMSNSQIDTWYDVALKNGAVGGKVVGAGGGGFLMLYASDRNKLRHTMSKLGLKEVRFGFDFDGTKVIIN